MSHCFFVFECHIVMACTHTINSLELQLHSGHSDGQIMHIMVLHGGLANLSNWVLDLQIEICNSYLHSFTCKKEPKLHCSRPRVIASYADIPHIMQLSHYLHYYVGQKRNTLSKFVQYVKVVLVIERAILGGWCGFIWTVMAWKWF